MNMTHSWERDKLIYENLDVDVSVLLTSDKNKITGVAYVTDNFIIIFDRERKKSSNF